MPIVAQSVTAVMLALSIAAAAAAGPTGPGVCCLPGDCQNVADAAECAVLGGVFLPGEDCATSPCAIGACCNELICVEADAFSCITAGRDYAGAGTTCVDDGCDTGVGACCMAGACTQLSEDDSTTAGGTWLGFGTSCVNDPCELGACCAPGTCFDGARYECDAAGGTFFPGGDCAADPCSSPNDCPADALFGQARDDPDGFEALTSELSAGFRRFDDFAGVAGPIDEVLWYGLDLDFIPPNDFVECEELDPTFEIAFHEDAGGRPGAVVCTYTLTATRAATGILYLGMELNEYRVTLPQPCVLVNGWISIVGLGDPECWFLWMSAGFGGSWCEGCIPEPQDLDVSFCLIGEAGGVFGACCNDQAASCTDDVEISDCVAPGLRFVPDTLCANLDPPCGVILGACCFADGTCTIEMEADCDALGGTWLGANTLCDQCPCIVPCPPGSASEGEPVCGDGYVDDFNGGCDAPTFATSPLAIGQTVCGESGVFFGGIENLPDWDYYEITVTEATELTFTADAEFPAIIGIIDGNTGCPGNTLVSALANDCETLTVSTFVVPGTFWAVIRPTGFTDTSKCGARYTARVTDSSSCAADFDGDGVIGFSDLTRLLGSWGPCGFICLEDLDGDDIVGFTDLTTLLGTWGPC